VTTAETTLNWVGREYPNINVNGYKRDEVILGAPYLLTREWTNAVIVIARTRNSHNNTLVYHNGSNWHATLLNPPVEVGDQIYALERGDGKDSVLRRDRIRTVTAVTDDGVMAKYSTYDPFLMTVWVKAEGSGGDPKRDRHNPDRRKIVIDRLSDEGISRIGDTGYATSMKEFFEHFDLPRPEVEAWAFVDVEREVKWADMGYDARDFFTRDDITSLRTMTLKGRAKITLPQGKCRCSEVTEQEALKGWDGARRWKTAKLHKVECIWCMNKKSFDEAVSAGDL